MKKRVAIILFFIIELLIIFVEIKYLTMQYGIDRILILSLVNLFLCSHLFFDINKMYDFIYKKRYAIAVCGLLFISLLGYHGSSISVWNKAIQPNSYVESGSIVLGVPRGIRGDEYYVTTPSIISQYFNDFDAKSDILMGRSGYVTMFPNLPCKSIALLGSLGNLPYLFLPLDNAFAMSWFLKVFLIFFASFELCMLVCENKRLYALMGAFMITFSGASVWWSNMLILGWGALAIVIMHLFLNAKSVRIRLVYSIIMGLIGANYLMMMYPAWQVPFGYLYLGFFIWLWIKNKKVLSFRLLLYIPMVLAVMFGIFLPVFLESYDIYLQTISTVYPGERLSIGGSGYDRLFGYYLSLFLPIKPFFNPSEYGNFMSFYPLPIIGGVVTCLRNKIKKLKVDSLLVILTIIAVLLSIWNYVEIPVWLSKISLLSFSTSERSQLVVGYICLFIIIRIMALYENKVKILNRKLIVSGIISILFNVVILFLLKSYFKEYVTSLMIIVLLIIFIPIVTMLILNNRKTNKIVAISLICVSFVTGVVVNPVAKGVGVLNEKPVAREIQKIVMKDKNARWITVSDNHYISNYMVANGAITINSTNYYPNMELWRKFDIDKSSEYIYNRYAHITFKFIDDKTNFELIYPDLFNVNLNVNDLDKLDVDYILSDYDIKSYMSAISDCIYSEDGLYIYKFNE